MREKGIEAIAVQVVNELFEDMDDRRGFDTGGMPKDVRADWKTAWVRRLEVRLDSARLGGYVEGRDQAAEVADQVAQQFRADGGGGLSAEEAARRIRSMVRKTAAKDRPAPRKKRSRPGGS